MFRRRASCRSGDQTIPTSCSFVKPAVLSEKRETGVGPATSTLARWRSTTELFPRQPKRTGKTMRFGRRGSLRAAKTSLDAIMKSLAGASMMREKGLEPSRPKAPDPKSGVSAIPPLSQKSSLHEAEPGPASHEVFALRKLLPQAKIPSLSQITRPKSYPNTKSSLRKTTKRKDRRAILSS